MDTKKNILQVSNQASNNSADKALAGLFGGDIRSVASMSPFAKNPFAAQPEVSTEVPADAPEGSYTYALVKSGPDMAAEECETAAQAIEVMILWGNSVLHVAHMSPPRSFWVGEEQIGSDFVLPVERLGAARMPIVLVAQNEIAVVLPPNAEGWMEIDGQRISVRQAIDSKMTQPCAEFAGAEKLVLRAGAKAKLEIGGLTFQIAAVNAGRSVKSGGRVDTKSLPYHGISFALHAGVLAAAAFFMPPLANAAEDTITPEQKYMIQHALGVSAERELEESKIEKLAENNQPQGNGAEGARSRGSEGAMGSLTSHKTGGHFGIEGPKDNMDPQIARAAALRDVSQFGMIGLLNSGLGGDPNAPTAPWGGLVSLGNDPKSALGNMWGNTIDDSAGSGGLGLTGTGEGGGGIGEGIGIGRVGTVGDGLGGPGGIGRHQGFTRRAHRTGTPSMRPLGVNSSGKLPAEIIQRIVRQNFGRFRFCYENGLRGNPSLAGRVAVRFVIGRDGAVSQVANGGSDLPDNGVVSCVVRGFYGLSFPAPEDGIVTVTYPIMFSPGN